MYKIKVLNKISEIGLSRLSSDNYNVSSEVDSPDAILLRSHKMDGSELNSTLKAIGRAGAGVNNIPVDSCTEKGIVVFNTPGANANAVKELVLTGLFLTSRKIVDGINWAGEQKGQGSDVPKLIEKTKSRFGGNEITGKTLGLVGLGAIGRLVANDAAALGMTVDGYDPFISVDNAWMLSRRVKKAKALESLLCASDYLSLHLPLGEKTEKIIDKEKFKLMKKGVKILNFSRGELVDTDALKDALKDGTVSCYITDFPTDDILGVEGVLPVPHLGASTSEAEDNCAMMITDQVKDFLENGNIENSVNFPACSLGRISGTRVAITADSNSTMVGQCSTILAEFGLNILDMQYKSRGDISYSILDVETDVSEEVLQKLKDTKGVMRVRKFESA